jgi:hypothetical protein
MAETAALLTEDEVATRLKCSRKTVQRRPIPYHKDSRKSPRRYRQEDVEAYLRSIRVAKQPEEQPSVPSLEPKEEARSGLRAGKSRRGGPTVQLAQDELSGALARALRRKSKGRRSARNGTPNTKSDSETLAA